MSFLQRAMAISRRWLVPAKSSRALAAAMTLAVTEAMRRASDDAATSLHSSGLTSSKSALASKMGCMNRCTSNLLRYKLEMRSARLDLIGLPNKCFRTKAAVYEVLVMMWSHLGRTVTKF